jgi:multiple sugar transport system substrate-binding protein
MVTGCTILGLSKSGDALTTRDFHLAVAEIAKQRKSSHDTRLKLLIPNGCGDNVLPVASRFTELTGIDISMDETPVDDINTQLILNTLSGDGKFDIAIPATFGLPDLVAANSIIPLTQYAAKYEPMGFRSNILYRIGDSFDSEIYGFQTDGDAYVMFYNKAFLDNPDEKKKYEDRFGAPLAIPETWGELDQQMSFFHRPDQGRYGGLLYRIPGYLAWEWWVRFHAKGIWPLAPDLKPQINSDAGIAALEEMIEATNYLAPEVFSLGLFENWQRYGQGDIYCNIGWGGSQKYLNGPQSEIRGNMVYGPTPGGIVDGEVLKTPYFNWGWNYVVTADSLQPEVAYLFTLFASTPAMSTISVQQQGGYFDPIQKGQHQDPKIEKIYSRAFLEVHEHSLETAIPDLYLANQGEYFNSLNSALSKALSGKLRPEIALRRVADEWQLISKRSGIKAQSERWEKLRQKYPKKVRSQLRDIPA